MAYRPRFNSREREALWLREVLAAYQAGRGRLPVCNLCDLPVAAHDDWEESHDPGRARAFGGTSTAIAHRLCNHRHGGQVVVPALAKSNRVRRKHIGAAGPGRGRCPLPAGRRSRTSKSFNHGLVPRLTHAEKHARFKAARAIGPAEECS